MRGEKREEIQKRHESIAGGGQLSKKKLCEYVRPPTPYFFSAEDKSYLFSRHANGLAEKKKEGERERRENRQSLLCVTPRHPLPLPHGSDSPYKSTSETGK